MPRGLKTVAAALFALSPLLVGGFALEGLRPAPATNGPARELILAAGDDAAATARAFPGRTALPVAGYDGELDLAGLPFDRLVIAGELPIDAADFGFQPQGNDPNGRVFSRPRRWSVIDEWAHWPLSADHGRGPTRCAKRFVHGGYGCGHGIQVMPDLLTWQGNLVGAVRLTPVPSGSRVEILIPEPPARVQGWVVALSDEVELGVTRAGQQRRTRCATKCTVELPSGQGPLMVWIVGPSQALAFNLFETAP